MKTLTVCVWGCRRRRERRLLRSHLLDYSQRGSTVRASVHFVLHSLVSLYINITMRLIETFGVMDFVNTTPHKPPNGI